MDEPVQGADTGSRKPWVELRVHGVSGTPPESLLGTDEVARPTVRQVAGDDYSSFHRPVQQPADGHLLEGYHWGRFTSGTWRQALTLFFLPFGMINATAFMVLPPRDDRSGRALHAVSLACLRAVGILLTALFSFSLGLILIDLIGWRWAPAHLPDGFPSGWALFACVLAAGGGVWLLSRLAQPGFIRVPDPAGLPEGRCPGSALALHLYAATTGARTLRRLHIASGLGVIGLLADMARTGTTPGDDGGVLRVVVGATLALVVLMVVVLGDPTTSSVLPASASRPRDRLRLRMLDAVSALVVLLAVALVVIEALAVIEVDLRAPVADPAALERLVRFDEVADGLMRTGLAALTLLLLSEAITVGRFHRSDQRPRGDAHAFRPYAWGWTGFLLASLAVFVGIGFSAAAATAVASTLDLSVPASVESVTEATAQVSAGTTPMLDRVAYAWGLTVFELAAIAAAVWLWRLLTRKQYLRAVEAAYARPPEDATRLPAGWPSRVAGAMFVARLKTALPVIVTVVITVGMAISVVQLVESFGCADGTCIAGGRPWGWLSEPRGSSWSVFVINIGAWVLLGGAGLAVTVSRGALRDSGLRRGINVVWDIFGFWPHAVHPFGPAAYSRWTVVELHHRIRYHLEEGHPRVVVAAHSQGSVISFAALLLLTDEERARVAFLTCGSQLRLIYPRAFPAYFSLESVRWLFEDALQERWINLYRSTDPLAGPVLSWAHEEGTSRHFPLVGTAPQDDGWRSEEHRTRRSGHDWRLIDPVPSDAQVQTGPVAAIHGHHDFWLDPGWQRALDRLRPP